MSVSSGSSAGGKDLTSSEPPGSRPVQDRDSWVKAATSRRVSYFLYRLFGLSLTWALLSANAK